MYMVEDDASGFTSIPKSIYWCILVTMTTVGYGDIAPTSPLGQFIASVIMVLGYGIIAVPTGIVSAEFTSQAFLKVDNNTQACPHCMTTQHKDNANIAISVEKSLTILIKELIYIAGPTGIGKTSLSILIAKYLKTDKNIRHDLRQIYKEMSIGTGVPSIEEQQGIKHHFIHNKSIHKHDAYKFEKEGLILLKKWFKKHDKVVMVGGSGHMLKH